jgi:hypothetical protein
MRSWHSLKFNSIKTRVEAIRMSAAPLAALLGVLFFLIPEAFGQSDRNSRILIWGEPTQYVNTRGEVCEMRGQREICRPPRNADEINSIKKAREKFEQEQRAATVRRCEFSLIWSWQSEMERHRKAANSQRGTIRFSEEELRWANHDLQNQRVLPSETVRGALASRDIYSGLMRDAVAKLDLHNRCARYAEAKALGKTDAEAFVYLEQR